MTTVSIDTIREAQKQLEAIGPIPFWASHTALRVDAAWRFTFGGVEYVGAHPDFWARLPADLRVNVGFGHDALGSIEIRNLDADRAARSQFYDAMAGAFASGQAS